MRTAQICPTCSTHINALCVLYNGDYLSCINVSPLDNLERVLELIDGSVCSLNAQIANINSEINNLQTDVEDLQPKYKSYVATIVTNAYDPVTVTELNNEIGSIVWTYNPDEYELRATTSSLFITDKTFSISNNGGESTPTTIEIVDSSMIRYFFSSTSTIYKICVEIRVYN
jgi:hypothetical protein